MELDYEKLGFKAGLECHQQLEGKKLFCNCLTLNSGKEADIKVERKLRAVAGELGIIDEAAKYEMAKGKKFLYESSSEDTCLVEYDDEPPHQINKDALYIALQVALLLNAKVVDEIQVMRKTVIDGSNTSGFQRTALIARNGFIETSKGNVSIPTICLEEEAAQKIKESKDFTEYRLDRLGIPLIEIATGAELKDPEHVKETAEKLGMLLRSTGGCKRGIGTIRQDINSSIKGHPRVEIKGFQELKSIPKIIEYEVKRQLEEIKKGKKLNEEVRKAEPNLTTSFLRPMPGAERMYPETDVIPIKCGIKNIKLPELIQDKIKNLEGKYKISRDLATQLVKEEIDFEKYAGKFKNIEPGLIASSLILTPKDIKARYNKEVTEEQIAAVLSLFNDKKIPKSAVNEILLELAGKKELKEIIKKYEAADNKEIEEEIKKIIKEKPGLSAGAYMGIVMAKYRGKADGNSIMDILKKFIK
ncbi:Glu-tRNA(Gln) amidotransferase subunit GatE [Candidatus Woesearchaeota archaeon]|nr:Glu-tRNA(Gln) amidotransferase subunit GatE [Candidatus Woesearchaeota archaeon]